MSNDKSYTTVRDLLSIPNWMRTTSLEVKKLVSDKYSADKEVPESFYMEFKPKCFRTISIHESLMNIIVKDFSAKYGVDLDPTWFQTDDNNQKEVLKIKAKIASLKDLVKGAKEVINMSKTVQAIADNKSLMKHQNSVIKEYDSNVKRLAVLSKSVKESSLKSNGFLCLLASLHNKVINTKESTILMKFAEHGTTWKGKIESSFKKWMINNPALAYDMVFEPMGVKFTKNELVEACKKALSTK